MDKPLKTKMLDTTINKLLESIERLTRLNYLEMTSCLRLQLIATYPSYPEPKQLSLETYYLIPSPDYHEFQNRLPPRASRSSHHHTYFPEIPNHHTPALT